MLSSSNLSAEINTKFQVTVAKFSSQLSFLTVILNQLTQQN